MATKQIQYVALPLFGLETNKRKKGVAEEPQNPPNTFEFVPISGKNTFEFVPISGKNTFEFVRMQKKNIR